MLIKNINKSTLEKIIEFRQNKMMLETGSIFRNLNTGQTYYVEDRGPNFNQTSIIDLHPSEWFELEAAQKKEDENWKKLAEQMFKFTKKKQ